MALRECDYCTNQLPLGKDPDETKELRKDWIQSDTAIICPECRGNTDKPTKVIPDHAPLTNPIAANEVLQAARTTDASHTQPSDLFVADTAAIKELVDAIDADEKITNKPYARAVAIQERIQTFKKLIFEKNKEIVALNQSQANHQIYLNRLANTLRQDEREKLQLQDINYKPKPVKIPVNKTTIRKAKQRVNKDELRAAARELNIPEFTLQMLIVSKNLTVAQAKELFKKSIAAAQAEMAPPKPVEPVVTEVTNEITDMSAEPIDVE